MHDQSMIKVRSTNKRTSVAKRGSFCKWFDRKCELCKWRHCFPRNSAIRKGADLHDVDFSVGALLDKDFLFQQRVWFLKKTPSIDGITASGDNISVEHNEGVIYRVKPRDNADVNKWWITDEVRYGWKFVHSENRLKLPAIKGRDAFVADDAAAAWSDALSATMNTLEGAVKNGGRLGVMVSPMLTCEDAFLLASTILSIDAQAELAVGPIPVLGQD